MPSVFTMKMPTNMVVPHHGSKFLSFTYGINYVPGNAYISAGLNSHHCEEKATIPSGKSCKCHPHDCHLLYLYNSGYNVHKTQDTDVYGLYLG